MTDGLWLSMVKHFQVLESMNLPALDKLDLREIVQMVMRIVKMFGGGVVGSQRFRPKKEI